MKIISGSSNPELAKKIAEHLHLSLTPLEIFVFPDGERRVQVRENVVEQDCLVVQPTNTPVDTHYIELFLIVDALKRSGARDIIVAMPYVGYQRQDHVFRSGEAVSLDVMIRTLESLGISKIIAFDLHSIKIPEQFHVSLTHLSALGIFADSIKQQKWDHGASVLVSPDMGGIRRIKILSELVDLPYITMVKNRDLDTGVIETSSFGTEESSIDPKTSLREKKRAIIVDDMTSSGKTLVEAAKLAKKHGAQEIYAFVTHAIFSEDAPKLLQDSVLTKVYVTDSVYVPKEKRFDKLEIVSIAEPIASQITIATSSS